MKVLILSSNNSGRCSAVAKAFPEVPFIAFRGVTEESIRRTIRAGANANTYTPPSAEEFFKITMAKYREMQRES